MLTQFRVFSTACRNGGGKRIAGQKHGQSHGVGTMELGGRENDKEMFQKLTLADPACGIVLKERYPWDTPTESCDSDMTEVEVMQFRAPPGLPDPPIEETRIRESMLGCQTDVTAKAESRLHPRYKQMKDARPFEAIVGEKSSSELSDRSASQS